MSPRNLPVQNVNNAMFLQKVLGLSFIGALSRTADLSPSHSPCHHESLNKKEKRHFGFKKM
uniref:Uncharacterized protein n=1 Tax=Pan paniscus TaxID=9597 RepID=A0A2R9CGJ9_PANPA